MTAADDDAYVYGVALSGALGSAEQSYPRSRWAAWTALYVWGWSPPRIARAAGVDATTVRRGINAALPESEADLLEDATQASLDALRMAEVPYAP